MSTKNIQNSHDDRNHTGYKENVCNRKSLDNGNGDAIA